jgi:hypothetical protein
MITREVGPWSPRTSTPQEGSMMPPSPGPAVGFDADIRPLFRDSDIRAMRFLFDLSSFDDVSSHADGILERLRAGDMPCDDPWPADRIGLFASWVSAGKRR